MGLSFGGGAGSLEPGVAVLEAGAHRQPMRDEWGRFTQPMRKEWAGQRRVLPEWEFRRTQMSSSLEKLGCDWLLDGPIRQQYRQLDALCALCVCV